MNLRITNLFHVSTKVGRPLKNYCSDQDLSLVSRKVPRNRGNHSNAFRINEAWGDNYLTALIFDFFFIKKKERKDHNRSNSLLPISPALVVLCLTFLSTTSIAQTTIESYQQVAAKNNPDLKASYVEFEAALQRENQVTALADPRLSFGYFISPIETRVGPQRAKVSLSQLFPWFGTLKAKGNRANYLAEAKYQSFINDRNKLFWEVNIAYYPLYELHQHVQLLTQNLKILKTYKRLATSSFENNRGSMVDVIRVDIMIENAETELVILNNQTIPLQVRFNKLLNRSDSIPVIISDLTELLTIEKDYRRDSLLVGNPMIESLELQQKAMQESELLARKSALPQFGVGLDYAFIAERSEVSIPDNGKDAFMPMVSISLPIFRKRYSAAIKEAKLSQKAIEYRKKAIENSLVSNYENASFQLHKATDLIALYNLQIIKTKQLIQLLYSSYSNSAKGFEEVLRIQQQLLKYQMAKATAKKNYKVSLAEIEYLTSK
ncbi:MAG: TolC family protein [Flavobacteriales bacterium]|nr:TolC family protein [Flavobacteriales bacterium]